MEEYPPLWMRMCPVSPLLLKGLRDFDNVLENKGNIVKLYESDLPARISGEVLFKRQ